MLTSRIFESKRVREARQEARQQALKEGREEGLQEGREEGLQEGREEGLQEGREEGLQEGRQEIENLALQADRERLPGESLRDAMERLRRSQGL